MGYKAVGATGGVIAGMWSVIATTVPLLWKEFGYGGEVWKEFKDKDLKGKRILSQLFERGGGGSSGGGGGGHH